MHLLSRSLSCSLSLSLSCSLSLSLKRHDVNKTHFYAPMRESHKVWSHIGSDGQKKRTFSYVSRARRVMRIFEVVCSGQAGPVSVSAPERSGPGPGPRTPAPGRSRAHWSLLKLTHRGSLFFQRSVLSWFPSALLALNWSSISLCLCPGRLLSPSP